MRPVPNQLLFNQLFEPFTQARLDALNRDYQPVLVAIHADRCSTCKTPQPVHYGPISRLMTAAAHFHLQGFGMTQ